jgi:predicted enzyme related to lactoylglutathione lyase
MRRVTGIGGIFFKAKDPKALAEWYRKHLGIDVQEWGGATFLWQTSDNPEPHGCTVWSLFPGDTKYLEPSESPFMVNYRVEDLGALLEVLKTEGCHVIDKTEDSEFGKFGWVLDPEGNKVELWEPPVGPMGGE